MQALMSRLGEIEQAGVLRVDFSQRGMAELDAAGGYDRCVSAELLDAAGEVCGRARRYADPCARAYGLGLSWHVQIGGVMASRTWAGRPMGCGCGERALDAAQASREDLLRRSNELLAQAARIGAMLGDGGRI